MLLQPKYFGIFGCSCLVASDLDSVGCKPQDIVGLNSHGRARGKFDLHPSGR